MSLAAADAVPDMARRSLWPAAWALLLAATLGLWLGKDHWSWAVKYPRGWVVPLKRWIGDFMKWLINDFDLGLFTFKEFTRGIAWVLEWPHWLAKGLLAQGFKFPTGEDAFWLTPTLSWLGLVVVLTLLAWRIKDRTLALLIGLCFLYLAVFGQWDSAMVTLSSIMVAVPLGVAGGLALGIQGYRSPHVERVITPVLDLMQTVPVFAYLVPILFLFGFGPVAAMIATMIYAMPPMVRVTMLALKMVPEEIKEFGRMAGCSRRQMMWKVLVPAARPTLMVGVNQVIMLSLNMVIIASMIGAGGLGHDVLASLRRLAIGQGLEAGIAITLLAVALDRLSQAFSQTAPAGGHEADHEKSGRKGLVARHPYLIGALVVLFGATLLGLVVPPLSDYPEAGQVTTGPFWDALVRWININFFDQLEAVKTFLLLNLMIPFKRFLLQLPWPAVVAMVALAGFPARRLAPGGAHGPAGGLHRGHGQLGEGDDHRLPLRHLGGLREPDRLSGRHLVGAQRPGPQNCAGGDRYPADLTQLRLLDAGGNAFPGRRLLGHDRGCALRDSAGGALHRPRHPQNPAALIEAARTSGCTRRQLLWKVQMPLALPEIMLGVNQTIMFALSMLVITALVGTRDLGQEVYIALTKADTGRGIVAGLCVAFIAITADRLIGAWARRRKQQLGFE